MRMKLDLAALIGDDETERDILICAQAIDENAKISSDMLTKLNASPLALALHGRMTVPVNERRRQRIAVGLLAADIQKMLLQGNAPQHITPDMLISRDLPMDWDEQRRLLGFS